MDYPLLPTPWNGSVMPATVEEVYSSAGVRDGQRLNTTYGIWSSGLGEDCERDLTMTAWSSSLESGSSSNSRSGGEASGSHSG